MTTGTLSRPNANVVLQHMRDDDMADPWGTAMSWAFAVCDVLYDADPNSVPASLGYGPGMCGPEVPNGRDEPHRIGLEDVPYPTAELWCYLHNIDWDDAPDANDLPYWTDPTFQARADELERAAKILSRYLDWCKAAGVDY